MIRRTLEYREGTGNTKCSVFLILNRSIGRATNCNSSTVIHGLFREKQGKGFDYYVIISRMHCMEDNM
jgi:hypothetical protein